MYWYYYCQSQANRVVDRWLGAVSMPVVSTHLELHQLGCHKYLRATGSYTALVCLCDRFTELLYEELLRTLLLHA